MKIVKSKYKEEVWDDDLGKHRKMDRIEYLIKEGDELIAVCQKRAKAEEFVVLVKKQNAERSLI